MRIEDGPWLDRPSEPDVIAIGWLPDEGASVEWTGDPAGLDSDAEVFQVQGLVSAWDGNGVMKTARDRADVLLEAIRTELRSHQTLQGAVGRARLVTMSGSQYQTDRGCEFTIEFAVRINVF
ncbi:MAG: hypothetical protein ACREX8_01565 [Gammaproteobacteria bacterium]